MKTVNVVSFSALLLSGLSLMILGARIWSAPDVFAHDLGVARLSAEAIASLALSHGGALLALGLFAIGAAFLSSTARWIALATVLLVGLVAWFTVWPFAGAGGLYAPALKTLLLADGLAFIAVTVTRDADRAAPKPTDAEFHFRWG